MPAHSPTGDAPLWDCYTTWKPNWNALRPVPPGYASPPSLCQCHCHRLRRSPLADTCVPLWAVSSHGRRYDTAGPGNAPPAVFQKNRDAAIGLAAQGLSYARAGNWVGCVKSAISKWLRKAPLAMPELPPDGTLELDGLWTRTRSGRTELKVIYNAATGMALGSFGSWSEVIDRAWQQGAHQLSLLHLLREYRRNIGTAGFAAARRLDADSLAEGREWARQIMRATAGAARYWCEKALCKGLRHLVTGQARHRTTSRLERHNRELRRREKLGTVWTERNLLALLQAQGLLNQTT